MKIGSNPGSQGYQRSFIRAGSHASRIARSHREKSLDALIEQIIRARPDLEEATFADVRRDMAAR